MVLIRGSCKRQTQNQKLLVLVLVTMRSGLNVMTSAALFDPPERPVIWIFHEYAHLGKGRSIHHQ